MKKTSEIKAAAKAAPKEKKTKTAKVTDSAEVLAIKEAARHIIEITDKMTVAESGKYRWFDGLRLGCMMVENEKIGCVPVKF